MGLREYSKFFDDDLPDGIEIHTEPNDIAYDFIHIFAIDKVGLEHTFKVAKPLLKSDGMLWISWPKKTSGMETDLDKFYVMDFGKAGGLVDTKVAAIDEQWSGHKFVYRKVDRSWLSHCNNSFR